jgi:hypothetical protein
MVIDKFKNRNIQIIVGVVLLVVVIGTVWWFFKDRGDWPRGEALGESLRPIAEGTNPDRALVARAIWDNYKENRNNASRWSGIYWGFTFTAAILSALAALVLKLESLLKNDGVKKDLVALLSVAAALLITISSSGDFQRKWQANRIAAAELERIGYEFLEKKGSDARTYLGAVGEILLRKHLAIVGGTDQRKTTPEIG